MNTALPDRLFPGQPYPLGAISDGLGVNFAVFSANATKIELCIFDPRDAKSCGAIPCPNARMKYGTATCRAPSPG